MTKFEQTNTYKKILQDQTSNITIAYHVNTGIVVTEENLHMLIDQEMTYYENRIADIKKHMASFEPDPALREKIIDRITAFIGKDLCIVEYATFLRIDDAFLPAIRSIESKPDFVEWLAK
jgi:hypothetical protein